MLFIWIASVATIGGAALYWGLRRLRKIADRRGKKIRDRDDFLAVETESPLDDAVEVDKKRAVDSVEQHAAATRRLLVPVAIAVVVVVASLPFLGRVPAAYVSLVVAAFTIVLGVASRPLIENAIAGLVLSFSRRVNIGDTVRIHEHYGTIEDISPSHTTIKLWDWRRYVMPNRAMLDATFLNYSVIDTFQWAYVEFYVSLDADIDEVESIAVEAAASSPGFQDYEPPKFWVMDMGRQAAHCWVAAWADDPASAWELTHGIRSRLIRELHRRGIRAHDYRVSLEPPPGAAPQT